GWPSLPETLDAELLARANRSAAQTLTRLRERFGEALLEGVSGRDLIDSLLHVMTSRELVHTSYFPAGPDDYPGVTSLVALHVLRPRRPADEQAVQRLAAAADGAWYFRALDDPGRLEAPPEEPAVPQAPHRLRMRLLQAAAIALALCLGGFFADRLLRD